MTTPEEASSDSTHQEHVFMSGTKSMLFISGGPLPPTTLEELRAAKVQYEKLQWDDCPALSQQAPLSNSPTGDASSVQDRVTDRTQRTQASMSGNELTVTGENLRAGEGPFPNQLDASIYCPPWVKKFVGPVILP
jgi:hypothetical protein